MNSKIDLHHVARFENHFFLTRVGRVMRNTIVQRKTSRESHARYETIPGTKTIVIEQRSHAVFDAHGNFRECLTRGDVLLRPVSDLTVNLRRLAVVAQESFVFNAITRLISDLLTRGASRILDGRIFQQFTGRVVAGRE